MSRARHALTRGISQAPAADLGVGIELNLDHQITPFASNKMQIQVVFSLFLVLPEG